MQATAISRLLCFLAALCCASAVFRGDNAPPALYRFFVDMYTCGGALISSKFVITSAFCALNTKTSEMEVSTRSVDRVSWRSNSAYKRRLPIASSKVTINDLYTKAKADNGMSLETIINDIAIFELEKPVSVCDNVFGPLAILLPLDSEETAENMVKKDKYHQCIQAGFGSQIKKDEPEDHSVPVHMKQQRIRQQEILESSNSSGPIIEFYSENRAHACWADDGSPVFCIVNDKPTMVSLVSTFGDCGRFNSTALSGPSVLHLMPAIENMLSKEQWTEVLAEQEKCRGYYEKNGFLAEYVSRVKENKYPPKDDFKDNFVYPSAATISMDGSLPDPAAKKPEPTETPDQSYQYSSFSPNFDSLVTLFVAIVLVHGC